MYIALNNEEEEKQIQVSEYQLKAFVFNSITYEIALSETDLTIAFFFLSIKYCITRKIPLKKVYFYLSDEKQGHEQTTTLLAADDEFK